MFTQSQQRLRYFTPIEANSLLRQILPEMERAIERAHHFEAILTGLRAGTVSEAEKEESIAELQSVQKEIEAIVEAIHGQGVEVKGLRQGLLDFPALRNGQEVFLCWRAGEAVICHWHPIAAGFSGRMPLDPNEEPGLWEWCN